MCQKILKILTIISLIFLNNTRNCLFAVNIEISTDSILKFDVINFDDIVDDDFDYNNYTVKGVIINGQLAPYQLNRVKELFFKYPNLENISLPNQTGKLPRGMFSSNWKYPPLNLKSFSAKNITEVEEFAFARTKLENISLPNVVTLNYCCFYCCKELKSVNLPEVTLVEKDVFRSCSALTEINMSKLIKMHKMAFYDCNSLKYIKLDKLIEIGDSCFVNCTMLGTIDFPQIQRVGRCSFENCNSIKFINWPNILLGYITDNHVFRNTPTEQINITLSQANCKHITNENFIQNLKFKSIKCQ